MENLLGHAKSRYTGRFRGSQPPTVAIFEPQDFDPEFDRHLHASENLDKMFEDVIGCEDIINKLREYQKISRVMKARGEDTRDLIPTNFVFKGPPGVCSFLSTRHNINLQNTRYGEDYRRTSNWASVL